ncbi:hypothetical protein GIB67_032823 [Kingdonia uniflora]|uniref:3'(2'),5'-bisphosphate nucleotidase n=1 Tax=Kingdonia uniflora TaxID=39325 RepID=A0A7J7NBR3_9MAGN|nr:hypothetical protein GIB67_032823 [Kingdonia uniflora]
MTSSFLSSLTTTRSLFSILVHKSRISVVPISAAYSAIMCNYEKELAAAKKAASLAARLCQKVQKEILQSDVQSKSDKSPVTVADYGSQALVSFVLERELLSGSFSLVAEEDSGDLREEGASETIDRIKKLVNDTIATDGTYNVSPLSAEDVLTAIDSGKSEGGPHGRHWVLDPIDGTKGQAKKKIGAWQCRPKMEGGLGVRDLMNVKQVLFSKKDGIFFMENLSGKNFLRSKYIQGGVVRPVTAASILQQNIKPKLETITVNAHWIFGEGEIDFWKDDWTGEGALADVLNVEIVRWGRPNAGVLKLNTDGSAKSSTGMYGAGLSEIVMVHMSLFFSKGPGFNTVAELCGLLHGLKFCKLHNIYPLVAEVDSLVIAKRYYNISRVSSKFVNITQEILALRRDFQIAILHVFREADVLAKLGCDQLNLSVWLFAELPTNVEASLIFDKMGVAHSGIYRISGAGFLRGDQYAIALALLDEGKVVLGVLACPNLPQASIGHHDHDSSLKKIGCLFSAKIGSGTYMQSLDGSMPIKVNVSAIQNPTEASFFESYEAAHSLHSLSSAIAKKLGVQAAPVRIDSQAKYGALARGDGAIYLRFPHKGYKEKIWDHAAGCIVVTEAGGVATDAAGNPLDFSKGRFLDLETGIIVTNQKLMPLLLKAVRDSLNEVSQGAPSL